jgi:hypothetical protein
MAALSSIIIIMLWIFVIIYACVKSGVYDPYELTNTEYFNDSFYFLIFIGLYSFAILLNIALPSPFTLNGLLQSVSSVLYNISLFLAVCYLVIKEGYNAYNLRDTSDWIKTDDFWRYFLVTQVVVILLSITWPYSFSVSRTVWFQLVIPVLNQIITLLGGLLFVVYFLYDPYNWKESPWFSYHILLWIFVLLYAVTYILNSFPTAITNGLLFPTDIMKIQNTAGVSLTSLMYIDTSGNKMIYDISGNPLVNNNSIYLVPKPNAILIGTDTNANVYGFATLDYIKSILLLPIGRSTSPYGMYVTGNNITPVSSQAQNTKNIIPSIPTPTNFIMIEDNLPMPTSMIIANCNPCDAGPSAITLTSSSTSKTFTLGSYKDNKIQSILLGVNTLPSTITDGTNTYTSSAILNLGQIRINEYIACYAKHADGTQSCSIIYNCGRVKVYDLMNSAGTIRFFTVPSESTPAP